MRPAAAGFVVPALLCAALLPCPAAGERGGHLAPPRTLACSRDHLTSFMGRVLAYERGAERIALRVRTDEGTDESFKLRFSKAEGPARWLLLHGRPFNQEEDWTRVEKGPGRLRDGMRVIVWVCDDGGKPVLDWRPVEG